MESCHAALYSASHRRSTESREHVLCMGSMVETLLLDGQAGITTYATVKHVYRLLVRSGICQQSLHDNVTCCRKRWAPDVALMLATSLMSSIHATSLTTRVCYVTRPRSLRQDHTPNHNPDESEQEERVARIRGSCA